MISMKITFKWSENIDDWMWEYIFVYDLDKWLKLDRIIKLEYKYMKNKKKENDSIKDDFEGVVLKIILRNWI